MRIYRELKRLNSPKINDPMKKLGKEMHIAFHRRKSKMSRKQIKKCSTSISVMNVIGI
jgi:hypothetical protein